MDEDKLNMELRKFLKKVGVTAQRSLEQAIRDAVAAGQLNGSETLTATVTLTLEPAAGDPLLTKVIDGAIDLA